MKSYQSSIPEIIFSLLTSILEQMTANNADELIQLNNGHGIYFENLENTVIRQKGATITTKIDLSHIGYNPNQTLNNKLEDIKRIWRDNTSVIP